MKLFKEIKDLLGCEPTDIPFINLFLDTRMAGTEKRNCDIFLEIEYKYLHYEFLLNGGDNEAFIKSWEIIKHILDTELNNSTKGLVLILRPGQTEDCLFIKKLEFPIKNNIIVDGIPQVGYLVELIDENDISA